LIGLSVEMIGDYYALYVKAHSLKFNMAGYFTDYLSLPIILLAIGIFNFFIMEGNEKLFENFFKGKILRILQVLANSSYGIYLIHPFIVSIISEVLGVSIDSLRINVYLYNLTFFTIVLVISILITSAIIKIPKIRIIIGG